MDPASGNVLVLLQPAEETAAGAPSVLNEGVLDGVAAIVGGHVDMRYELGTIVADTGAMAASADEFVVRLRGAGAHAARPHEGVNPITGGAALVSALQSVVTHAVAPGTPAVITVATFKSGVASNVIPESATISGSVRAISAADRRALHGEIARVVDSVAEAFRLDCDIEFQAGTPPLVNDAKCAEWARQAARNTLGDQSLRPLAEPNLGGEDFAFYLEKLPGCFFRVGGRGSDQESVPAHSSRFLPTDDAVLVGAMVLAETARLASSAFAQK
jgi:hippurate hydrolase